MFVVTYNHEGESFMKSSIVATIVIAISGLIGLPAIFYVFGSASVATGSTIGNEALTDAGWGLIGMGTLVLIPMLIIIVLMKSRR